jgi:uncharacterized membrane protein YhhN
MQDIGSSWLILTGILLSLVGIFIHPGIVIGGFVMFLIGMIGYTE